MVCDNHTKYHPFLNSIGDMLYSITVYPKKYAHGFVVRCFVVVMQSFIMNSHEVFIHIHRSCFAGTRAIVRLPECQWSKPDGYGKISQCITTTKHSKAKTVCIFLGIYCIYTSLVDNLYLICKLIVPNDTSLFWLIFITGIPVLVRRHLHSERFTKAKILAMLCIWLFIF